MNIFLYNKNSWIILRRTEYSLILRILDKRKKKQQILKKPCSELPLQKQTPDRSFLITISILNHSPKPTQTSNFFHYTEFQFLLRDKYQTYIVVSFNYHLEMSTFLSLSLLRQRVSPSPRGLDTLE